MTLGATLGEVTSFIAELDTIMDRVMATTKRLKMSVTWSSVSKCVTLFWYSIHFVVNHNLFRLDCSSWSQIKTETLSSIRFNTVIKTAL